LHVVTGRVVAEHDRTVIPLTDRRRDEPVTGRQIDDVPDRFRLAERRGQRDGHVTPHSMAEPVTVMIVRGRVHDGQLGVGRCLA
jgi:hypothetical protein